MIIVMITSSLSHMTSYDFYTMSIKTVIYCLVYVYYTTTKFCCISSSEIMYLQTLSRYVHVICIGADPLPISGTVIYIYTTFHAKIIECEIS